MYQIVKINNPETILAKTKSRINLKSLAAMLYFTARSCHNSYHLSNKNDKNYLNELECHYEDIDTIHNYSIVNKILVLDIPLFAVSDDGQKAFEVKNMFMTNDKSFYFYNDTVTTQDEIELYIVRYY